MRSHLLRVAQYLAVRRWECLAVGFEPENPSHFARCLCSGAMLEAANERIPCLPVSQRGMTIPLTPPGEHT